MATKLAFSSPAAPSARVFSGLPDPSRATIGTPITIWSLVPSQLESQEERVDSVVRYAHPYADPVYASQGKYVSAMVT